MAEPSDLLGLVEDIALDLQLPHHAEFPEMLQKFIPGDLCLERDGIFRQFPILRRFLVKRSWYELNGGFCGRAEGKESPSDDMAHTINQILSNLIITIRSSTGHLTVPKNKGSKDGRDI